MDYIDTLLEQLNSLFTLSEDFKEDLRPMLTEADYKKSKILLGLKGTAKKAWQLLQGYISCSMVNEQGNETVVRIYVPGQILTDFSSFLFSGPSTMIIKAATPIKVLELLKRDFLKLDRYPETGKLVQRILLQEQHIESTRAALIAKPEHEKVKTFASHYPIDHIPNEPAASFIHLPLVTYLHLKVSYQKSIPDRIENSYSVSFPIYKNSTEMVYAIKTYIENHFTNPDIGNTVTISKQFNTTRKTLTRIFTSTFHTTVYQLIHNLRMEYARTLIKSGMSVKEASSKSGHTSVHNFNRKYKKYFGVRPGKRSQNDFIQFVT